MAHNWSVFTPPLFLDAEDAGSASSPIPLANIISNLTLTRPNSAMVGIWEGAVISCQSFRTWLVETHLTPYWNSSMATKCTRGTRESHVDSTEVTWPSVGGKEMSVFLKNSTGLYRRWWWRTLNTRVHVVDCVLKFSVKRIGRYSTMLVQLKAWVDCSVT